MSLAHLSLLADATVKCHRGAIARAVGAGVLLPAVGAHLLLYERTPPEFW